MAIVSEKSDETHGRLLNAGAEIFAEKGYEAATTRQICERAGANAAAINYHFGDKLGLYKAVLRVVTTEHRKRTAEEEIVDLPPEQALREFIRRMVLSLAVQPADPCQRIMVNEMVQPTAGLSVVVEYIVRPRSKILCSIISAIIGSSPTSWQTRLAAYSVISQIVHYMHARQLIDALWPDWQRNPAVAKRLAAHIEEFSLGGLKQMRAARDL